MRQFIRDNAMMWFDEYHVDGLRFDMTLSMRAKVRVNTTWHGYSPDFTDIGDASVEAVAVGRDGLAASAAIECGPSSALLLS